ncbi:MAG: hypothetical protein ABR521_07455 [Gaiellaceae bacterium]
MNELPLSDGPATVVCPHCRKPFESELLAGAAPRYRGFKCPHCRLFVPHERAAEGELARPPA